MKLETKPKLYCEFLFMFLSELGFAQLRNFTGRSGMTFVARIIAVCFL